MNAKTILLRLAGFIAISVAGSFLYAVTANLLIYFNLMPDIQIDGVPFGQALTSKTTMVWMGTILLSFIAVFIKDNWRWILYAAPLYAPSLYAIFFTLSNKGAV